MDIIRFPDPFQMARDYLTETTGYPAAYVLPATFAKANTPLIVITDTGGAGEYDMAFEETRLTIDVWADPRGKASEIARNVYGLLREWQFVDPAVYWRGTVSRPTFYPDETRIPRYTLTVNLGFRGERVNLPPTPGTAS